MLQIMNNFELQNFICELAFMQNASIKGQDFIQKFMNIFAGLLSAFLNQNQIKIEKEVISKAMTMIQNLKQSNVQEFIEDFSLLI